MIVIAQERPEDHWEVEALYDLCFAPGREALSSYRLREGVAAVAALCRVARDEGGAVAGAIRYWPVRVEQRAVLLLGPVAVHPTHQGEGLGGWLIRESVGLARQLGWQRVLLVGDAPYYQRFGFLPLHGIDMPPPTNPARVLGMALTPNAWDLLRGRVETVRDHPNLEGMGRDEAAQAAAEAESSGNEQVYTQER